MGRTLLSAAFDLDLTLILTAMSKSKSKATDKSVRATQTPRWLGRGVYCSNRGRNQTVYRSDSPRHFFGPLANRAVRRGIDCTYSNGEICPGQEVKHHILCRHCQHYLILHTQCSNSSRIRCEERRKGRSREQNQYSSGAVGRNRNSQSRLILLSSGMFESRH